MSARRISTNRCLNRATSGSFRLQRSPLRSRTSPKPQLLRRSPADSTKTETGNSVTQGCTPRHTGIARQRNAEALAALDVAIRALNSPQAQTNEDFLSLFELYFKSRDPSVIRQVQSNLNRTYAGLKNQAKFRCAKASDCPPQMTGYVELKARVPFLGSVFGYKHTGPIHLCPQFFRMDGHTQRVALIHEGTHRFLGFRDDTYARHDVTQLPMQRALRNPDSYGQFALEPTLARVLQAGNSKASGATQRLQLQRVRKDGGGLATAAIEARVNNLRNRGGSSLPDSERSFFEPRFGRDFSDVRVHTGPDAAQIARSINARAFTIGRDVVFGANEYRPGTQEGRRLMAHELTHTVQQGAEAKSDQQSLRRTSSIGASGLSSMGTRSSVTGPTESTEERSDDFVPMSDPATGACKSARIQVRATHIGGFLSTLPIWHLLIVHTNQNGYQTYYRGGPKNPCKSEGLGGIEATYGEFKRGTVDWDPSSPRETVMEGPEACEKTACLENEAKRIHNSCTPYKPLGPNSNTFAGTLLEKCGIPRKKPVWIAPGFNDRNL